MRHVFGTTELICLHDLCRHAIGLDGYLAPLAVGLYALCGAVQALLVCVLIATAWRFLAWPMTPGLAIGLLSGLTILAMSVFCLTNLNALAAVVCGGILAVALARRTRLAHIAPTACVAVAVVAGALAAATLIGLSRNGRVSGALMWIAVPVAMILVAIVCRLGRRSTAGAALTALSALTASIVGALGVIWPAMAPASAAPTDSPHVVLLVLDTVRRDHFGCYGDRRGLTPFLDELAAEGVVYEDAVATAPWTLPTHASMLTGLFAYSHGCHGDVHHWLDDEFVTLPEMLRDQGYQTLAICANAVLDTSNFRQGFDEYVCLDGVNAISSMRVTPTMKALGWPQRWVDQGASRAPDALRDWFRRGFDPQRPLFLMVNVLEAHQPYLPPLTHRTAVARHPLKYWRATKLGARHYDSTAWDIRRAGPGPQADLARELYAASIRYQDDKLRRLFDVLARHVPLDETLLIITADHGECLGEDNRWGHTFVVKDAVLRVPLIVRYPPRFPAGTRLAGTCQLTDIVPTVFDVLERPSPAPDLPGRSLTPESFRPAACAFAEWSPSMAGGRLAPTDYRSAVMQSQRVLRDERYKFVWSTSGRHELFDLPSDPQEQRNLIDKLPDVAARMERALNDLIATLPEYRERATLPAKGRTRAEERRLRDLGYFH
ncbi:MAG: sulfatase-like hydrolase/transferase [Phycisphaerae bacterium]|nr:sulfatase-like hydrolase/transferase [Phycisphaerae bacterium]